MAKEPQAAASAKAGKRWVCNADKRSGLGSGMDIIYIYLYIFVSSVAHIISLLTVVPYVSAAYCMCLFLFLIKGHHNCI